MPHYYSNPQDETSEHKLPDIEVWEDRAAAVHCTRSECAAASIVPASSVEATLPEVYCPACGYHAATARYAKAPHGISSWFWQGCFPGCLPDGEFYGPFASEEEALADAREKINDDIGDAHRFLCHPNDEECPDGCDVPADPARLREYRRES